MNEYAFLTVLFAAAFAVGIGVGYRIILARAGFRSLTEWRFERNCYRQQMLRVECSWCGVVLRPGVEPVSHGICPSCAEAMRADFVFTPHKP